MREEYSSGSPPQHFEYFFQIERYGSLYIADRERILKGLGGISRELKSERDELGPYAESYSHEGVVLHIVPPGEDDEERVDTLMLQALVRELRLYSTSAIGAMEVLEGKIGPIVGDGPLESVASWQLVIRE